MIYAENDLDEIKKQAKARWMVFAVILAIGAAGIAVAFILRGQVTPVNDETMAMARGRVDRNCQIIADCFAILSAFAAIAYYGLMIAPVRAYRRFLSEVLHGRTREAEGIVVGVEDNYVMTNGVRCYAFTVNVGEKPERNDPEDERLFYFDANLGKPPITVGDKVQITSHDKMVGKIEKR